MFFFCQARLSSIASITSSSWWFYPFLEQVDPLVFQERSQPKLGRESAADHHLQHSRGLLGPLQSHRASVQAQRGMRLQSLQGTATRTHSVSSQYNVITSLETTSYFKLLWFLVGTFVNCFVAKFQEGIKPMWEDDYNKHGGRWLINLDKKQRMTCLDNFWLEVMLCLIGESFEDDSQLVRLTIIYWDVQQAFRRMISASCYIL